MLLETVPLYLLFEASVLLASLSERRQRAQSTNVAA
jgi:Sec-independent protein secretion pathway component TatC